MSHYSPRWDDQQAVPRGPRQDRHHPGYHQQGAAATARGPGRVQQHEDRGAGEEVEVEQADSEEFVFRGSTHPSMVLSGLEVLRKENSFTDVKIKVEESEFSVHKCVLSSFSPYFKAMFTAGLAETDQVRVWEYITMMVPTEPSLGCRYSQRRGTEHDLWAD